MTMMPAWMMNRMIGLEALYVVGLPPSSMPPCGAARSVLDAVADAMVFVTDAVMVLVTVDIFLGTPMDDR